MIDMELSRVNFVMLVRTHRTCQMKFYLHRCVSNHRVKQWFPKWAVPPPWGRWETLTGGGETEMDSWGAIRDPFNNYISVVLLTLSDQMS